MTVAEYSDTSPVGWSSTASLKIIVCPLEFHNKIYIFNIKYIFKYLLAVTSEREVGDSIMRASISVLQDSAVLHSSKDRCAFRNINFIFHDGEYFLHLSRGHSYQGVTVSGEEKVSLVCAVIGLL